MTLAFHKPLPPSAWSREAVWRHWLAMQCLVCWNNSTIILCWPSEVTAGFRKDLVQWWGRKAERDCSATCYWSRRPVAASLQWAQVHSTWQSCRHARAGHAAYADADGVSHRRSWYRQQTQWAFETRWPERSAQIWWLSCFANYVLSVQETIGFWRVSVYPIQGLAPCSTMFVAQLASEVRQMCMKWVVSFQHVSVSSRPSLVMPLFYMSVGIVVHLYRDYVQLCWCVVAWFRSCLHLVCVIWWHFHVLLPSWLPDVQHVCTLLCTEQDWIDR